MKQEINTLKVRAASGRHASISRRKVLLSGGGMLAAAAVLKRLDSAAADSVGDTSRDHTEGGGRSGMITLKDGATIFFKDWGSRNAQPIMDGL